MLLVLASHSTRREWFVPVESITIRNNDVRNTEMQIAPVKGDKQCQWFNYYYCISFFTTPKKKLEYERNRQANDSD